MSSRVIFLTSEKGAFRVEVAGTQPDDITRLMLTGQGDEHEIELLPGPYTVNVTNIGTGDRHSLDLQVGDSDRLLKIGSNRLRRSNWRSFAETDSAPGIWRATSIGEAASGEGQAAFLPILQTHTPSGWHPFSGTVMVNDDFPNTLKVVRPRTWSTNPLLRVEFPALDGTLSHCFVPLFSGGTVVRWHADDRRVIEIEPCEMKAIAIVGSLTNSIREELPKILEWAAGPNEGEAVPFVLNATDDPWIAAATGLLLLGSARLNQSGSILSRVATRSPWIADLGVLAAWGCAVDTPEDEAKCLDLLTRARESGTVYFWQTCSIADRLLSALASNFRSSAIAERGREEHGRWKRLWANAFQIGPFLGHNPT